MSFLDTLAFTIETGAASPIAAISGLTGWMPPQWIGYSQEASQLIYLMPNINNGTTGYFFDAILRYVHDTSLTITKQPVEIGAAITDHSYVEPARLVMDIGVSDVMSSLVFGQFGSASSKSISAYQTLVSLQYARTPMTVVTRLQTYNNMLIENIEAQDDKMTTYALKATITFQQILMAVVGTQTVPSGSQAQSVSGLSSTAGIPTGSAGNGMGIIPGSNFLSSFGGSSGCPNAMNTQLGTDTAGSTWSNSNASNIDASTG